MSLDNPVLRSHAPSRAIPYPFIVVEGEEGAGKSWAAALLSASPRVGRTFWLELGERVAEQYGAVPGARYEVLEHDGTYASVLEQVLAVREHARQAREAQEPPTVLVVDTMGNVWDGLKDWVSERAKERQDNQRKLAKDPAADLTVPRNLWNDAGNRYRRLMTALLTTPGIVVGLAKGGEISDTDPATGQPYRDGRKKWRIEGEKNLGYDATVIVRMRRGTRPVITKAQSVHAGVRPDEDPVPILEEHENLLDWLVFDALKADPYADAVNYRSMVGGDLLPEEEGDEDGRPPSVRQNEAVENAKAWAPKIVEQPYDDEFYEKLRHDARENGIDGIEVDHPNDQGRRITIEALIHESASKARAYREQQAKAQATEPQPDPTPVQEPEPAQESATAPPAAQEPAPDPVAPSEPAQEPQEAPTAPTRESLAGDYAVAALEEKDPEALRALYNAARDAGELEVDVLHVLTDRDRAVLGVPPQAERGNLGGLVMKVNTYVKAQGRAVRDDTPPAGWDTDTFATGEEPPKGWL